MSKNEFPLPEKTFILKIKLLIVQRCQQLAVAVHATLSAVIDEPVKDFPLIHFLKWSEQ